MMTIVLGITGAFFSFLVVLNTLSLLGVGPQSPYPNLTAFVTALFALVSVLLFVIVGLTN